jgi:hypothetical protein
LTTNPKAAASISLLLREKDINSINHVTQTNLPIHAAAITAIAAALDSSSVESLHDLLGVRVGAVVRDEAPRLG